MVNPKKTNKAQKGYTMVEMLMSCMIIVLISGLLVTITKTTFTVYENTVKQSEAMTLASTLKKAITNELYYVTDIDTDGGGITFFSVESGLGKNCGIYSYSGIVAVSNGYDIVPLASMGNYPHNLGADVQLEYVDDRFNVTIIIRDDHGYGDDIITKNFKVKPIISY